LTDMQVPLNMICLLVLFQGVIPEVKSQFIETPLIPETVQFGEIPDSLFDLEVNHDYPFEYLLNRVETRFTEAGGRIIAILDYHYRIRVLTDEPQYLAEAALVGIPYYYHDDLEEITSIQAITVQPDGEISELDESEISTAELNSRYRIREFLMPSVQPGSILEYRYRVQRRYIDELPDFYISNRVPTHLAHLTIHNEDYLRYDVIGSNLDFDVYYHEELIDTSSIPRIFTLQRPEPVSIEHWFARDIAAVDNEAYISSINDLRGRLKFQVSEFGRPRQPLDNSWEIVAAQIRRQGDNPYQVIEQLDELFELGTEISSEYSDPLDRIEAVFRFVNQNMTFNGVHRAFHETPLDDVLNGEPSDQAAINLVLMAMLKGAGSDPKPVYLSGRNFGRINKDFPSIYQFNQLLITANVEGQESEILMDASFAHSRPGLIRVESYNETGLVLSEDTYEWLDLQPEYSMFDIDVELAAELSDEGDLNGILRVKTSGYPANEIREDLSNQLAPEEIIRESFLDSYSDVRFQHTEIREAEPGEFPLLLTAEFTIPDYAISFQEGLQFRPMVVGYLQRNPFEDDERTAPVMLDAPEWIQISYDISLPEGYMVDSFSESLSTRMRGAELNEQYEIDQNRLRYHFEINISRREFSSNEYSDLRRIYDRWVFLSTDEWFIENRQVQ
jgi:hypothetical protein